MNVFNFKNEDGAPTQRKAGYPGSLGAADAPVAPQAAYTTEQASAPNVSHMSREDEIQAAELEKTFYSALTQNTYIEGHITTKDDMAFSGGLKGNIMSSRVVHLNGGIVEGSLSVGEIEIENGKVKGTVTSKGALTVDSTSLVIGDLRAQDVVCDGKIKGDIYVEGSIALSANAVVFGNIKAAEINIDPGAIVRGAIEVVRQSMISAKLFEFEEEFMDMSEFAGMTE